MSHHLEKEISCSSNARFPMEEGLSFTYGRCRIGLIVFRFVEETKRSLQIHHHFICSLGHPCLTTSKNDPYVQVMSVPVVVIDPAKWIRLLRVVQPSLRRVILSSRSNKRGMGIIRAVFLLGTGFYAGVYAAQNYNLPPFDDPQTLGDKVLTQVNTYLEQYRKDRKE